MNIKITGALVGLAALAMTGLATTPADATVSKSPTEHQYVTDLGPSWQWRHATAKQRRHAERAYLNEFGSWENGCKADLHHAYRGTTKHHKAKMVKGVRVGVLVVKGPNVKLAEYVDGICGD